MSNIFYGFRCVSRKMSTKRTPSRRVVENDVHEEIPPQVEQFDKVPHGAQGVHGAQGAEVPPKVIKTLLWKEVMRFRWFPRR